MSIEKLSLSIFNSYCSHALSKPAMCANLTRLLIILTASSYLPQYQRMISKGSSTGISPIYVFINNLVALVQFTVFLEYAALVHNGVFHIPESLMHSPPSVGDWLSIVQLGVSYLCASTFFFLWATYTPQRILKLLLIFLWAAATTVCFAPCIYHATHAFRNPLELLPTFVDFLNLFMIPLCPLALIIATVAQNVEIDLNGPPQTLSTSTLLAQAVLYAVLAGSQAFRVQNDPDFWRRDGRSLALYLWLCWVCGWTTLDFGIFSIGQFVLYLRCVWIGRREDTQAAQDYSASETSPLLSTHSGAVDNRSVEGCHSGGE
ncbi:hypothetical protein NA57DRAFT_76459 [Rhizodiscina lignyota]|uniref:Uncharacterized protein n=1 Tax=Rhizodiscina lignyota TaxID=1504668 RepID=A0A9P4IHE6_9PEZI|nr:hypothetical protein NA57DRAFT_76459 [Rhizodiscina lignyota]